MNLFKKLILVLIGLVLTSFGIKLLTLQLLTFGGTAGIASLLTYRTDFSWGALFFIVNLPFFVMSIKQLGKWFTLSSLLSITGISYMGNWFDIWLPPLEMNVFLASISAGIIIGTGVTFVLNNGSSLGGIHILGLYMEQRFGWNRGLIIFISDSFIVLFAITLVGWQKALLSIISIIIASSIIGRYKQSPIREIENNHEINDLKETVHP
jgi:uncharacterized membrane-anchored protein YitT (DUF2179 family)